MDEYVAINIVTDILSFILRFSASMIMLAISVEYFKKAKGNKDIGSFTKGQILLANVVGLFNTIFPIIELLEIAKVISDTTSTFLYLFLYIPYVILAVVMFSYALRFFRVQVQLIVRNESANKIIAGIKKARKI